MKPALPPAVVLALAAAALLSPRPVRADSVLDVTYDTPQQAVTVRGRVLLFEDRSYVFADRSPSPNPVRVAVKRWQVSLSPAEIRRLLEQVRATPLFKMKDRYGSATRRYVYSLRVRDGKREKTVEYWSGPDEDDGPPEEYRRLGAYLLALARRVTTGTAPNAAPPQGQRALQP